MTKNLGRALSLFGVPFCTKSIGACQVHNCEHSAHNCVLDTLHFYVESKARERREFREVERNS